MIQKSGACNTPKDDENHFIHHPLFMPSVPIDHNPKSPPSYLHSAPHSLPALLPLNLDLDLTSLPLRITSPVSASQALLLLIKGMQLAGVCWDAAKGLFGCAKGQATYVFKLEENLTSLKRKRDKLESIREDIQTSIEDAESMGEMQRTNQVNLWLQQVQNLQQEMEKIQGSQEIHNRCISGCCPKNCVSSYKLGKKVVKMILEADELATSGKHFLDKKVDYIARKLPRKVVNEMPCVETIGLELMLDRVWNSLEDENVGIIGLYGMGGAGKTTLMKRVHNELGKRQHKFDLVLWVVVSKDRDFNKLVMNDIRNTLGLKDDNWDKRSEDQRATKIYQVLKQKRFVLMLDDLWGKLELDKVGVPHPKDTNYQSKVVVTTRSEDVCDKMQAQKKFKVECLLENEAFALFCKHVGEDTLNYHRDIPELASEIAKQCGGLPLALITVGSSMAGEKSIEAWRRAKSDLRSSPLIASDLEGKVFCILKFSYDRLPDEAHKNCFLYCALYPEDYRILVEDLIVRWIGEGFLGKGKYKSKKSIYDMREEGQSIIKKLKLSCLLEDADNYDRDLWPHIKMHDVIRDMALWLGRDQDGNVDKVVVEGEAFVMDPERLNVVERISVVDAEGMWQVPVCPNLFTLCVRGHRGIAEFSNLQYMARLKVLDLSYSLHIENLPIEIGKLISLEFLSLSRTGLYRLPIELKNLKKLRIFIMEHVGSKLEIFPLEVLESLERLQVFRYSAVVATIEREGDEVLLLDKLECLPALEELGIQLTTVTGMHKLLNSAQLQGCLRHLQLQRIHEPLEMASLLASWSRMKHLEIIYLRQLDGIMEVSSIADTCDLGNLREAMIGSCHSITHLTWLRYAPLLERIFVFSCNSMTEVVKEAQDDDAGIDLFSNLRSLELKRLPELKSIHMRALPFRFLEFIDIRGCKNLRKLPLNSNSAKDTLIKIKGDPQWWSDLEWEDPASKHLLQSKFQSI